MEIIQIGSLSILLKWFLLGVSIILGLILINLHLRFTQEKEIFKTIFDLVTNTVFLGFISWKLSLLVLQPALVIRSPLSLLYFTGGQDGLILAIIVAVLYFLWKSKQMKDQQHIIWQTGFLFFIVVLGGYHLLAVFLINHSVVYHLFLALFSIGILLLFFYKKGRFSPKGTIAIGIILGMVGLFGGDLIESSSELFQVNEVVQNDEETKIGLQEGNKAPDFQLETLTGEVINLSDLKGKKIILNFWATWCPPCKAEMPHMQDFYEKHIDDEVEILAVNLTNSEKNIASIEEFVNEYGVTFPILLDQKGATNKTYQAITIPTTYFIDREGIIRKKIIGPMNTEMMEELVDHME
ncbi:redoxin domain-containing protein [Bacillus sp. AK128]